MYILLGKTYAFATGLRFLRLFTIKLGRMDFNNQLRKVFCYSEHFRISPEIEL